VSIIFEIKNKIKPKLKIKVATNNIVLRMICWISFEINIIEMVIKIVPI